MGTPIVAPDGELFGTVCGYDSQRQTESSTQLQPLLDLLSSLLSAVLAGDLHATEAERELEQARREADTDPLSRTTGHLVECSAGGAMTVRTEITDLMLIFDERHLRRVLAVYAAHHNGRRPHRALRLRPSFPTSPVPEPVDGRVWRRPILGEPINEHEVAA